MLRTKDKPTQKIREAMRVFVWAALPCGGRRGWGKPGGWLPSSVARPRHANSIAGFWGGIVPICNGEEELSGGYRAKGPRLRGFYGERWRGFRRTPDWRCGAVRPMTCGPRLMVLALSRSDYSWANVWTRRFRPTDTTRWAVAELEKYSYGGGVRLCMQGWRRSVPYDISASS
jgi:hypothetical protein